MKKAIALLFTLVIVTSLAACDISIRFAPTAAPTQPPVATTPVTPSPTLPMTTAKPRPTPTEVSPTPVLGPPFFTAGTLSNCRSGPSTNYLVLTGLTTGQTVQILGQWSQWWFVKVYNTKCWVSGSLGVAWGNINNVPIVYPPPLPAPVIPTPAHKEVNVTFKNETGRTICQVDFYVGITLVDSHKWERGKFTDGKSKTIAVAIGGYDLIEAYSCKPKLVASLTDIVVNKKYDSFTFSP